MPKIKASKLSKRIKKANKIVKKTWASGLKNLEFGHNEDEGYVWYSGYDSVTGLWKDGYYGYNDKGNVMTTGFYVPRDEGGYLSLSTDLLEGSKKAFKDYSYAFVSNQDISDALSLAYQTGLGEPLALANETLPGVGDRVDHPSTFLYINNTPFIA